jgi:hypothetical protein
VVFFVCGFFCLWFVVCGFFLFVVWLLPPHAGWFFFVCGLVFIVPVRGVFVFCLVAPASCGMVSFCLVTPASCGMVIFCLLFLIFFVCDLVAPAQCGMFFFV